MAYAEYWHHDGDEYANDDKYVLNFLHSKETPKTGGNTGFLDMKTAFDNLDEKMKNKFEGAIIKLDPHDFPDFKNAPKEDVPPPTFHQVFYKHPILEFTSIYIGMGLNHIEKNGQIMKEKGQDIFDLVEKIPGVFMEHKWEQGDILIWDNLQVAHRSMGGYYEERRLLYRGQARLASQ